MSKLEDLIKKLCPNGVPFKQLWEVTAWDKKFNGSTKSMQPHVKKFKHISAKELKSLAVADGDIKLLSTGNFDAYTSVNLAGEYINDDEIIAIPSGGSPIVKYYYGKFIDSGNILAVSSNKNDYNLKYIYHYLINNLDFLETCYRGSGIKHPDMLKVLNFTLPVPPIEVQREIVRILDNFTELTSELTSELTARRKQYQYYLNNFYGEELSKLQEKNLKLVTLKEIGTFQRGKRFVHADVVQIGVPCIHYGEIYTHYGPYAMDVKSHIKEDLRYKMRYASKNDVIIVGSGENKNDIGIGVAWLGDYDVAVHDACYTYKTSQNPKYISYFLRSDLYHKQIYGYVREGKICAISADDIGKAKLNLPPLEEQQRIVNILDKFDMYCNHLTKGLPAEIEARQNQYEYYRDKLLTFKKLEV